MKLRTRVIALASATATILLLMPASTDAQGRRVARAAPARSVVVVGGAFYGYRPLFYDPWYPYWGGPYAWGYPPYYGYSGYLGEASLRLQVSPRQTEVFIDGYYAGTVDDFDGFFQRLHVEPGEHDLELYLPGHRLVQQKVYLQPGNTFRVRHTMEAVGPGEQEPVRPTGTAGNAPANAPQSSTAPRNTGPRANPPQRPQRPGTRPGPNTRERGEVRESSYGTLALRIQPGGADVTIDGERWEGPAGDDRLVVQLAPGAHHIEVRKDGYRNYVSDINVRTSETSTLNVALSRP